ncbi:DNA alkylation repair protein [Cloacibacterium rupense]|uniref:DNA alkylation repair protein n=1 Tax=Cloacibacterium rupense TaxID=517423 RepID=A0ABQ2NHN3_9FLAO|nr:DNA alkylation repair protein [Cloacibacterium rupense]GGP03589.1 DNA alkylation repair protein [Cloacibacterium rupense]
MTLHDQIFEALQFLSNPEKKEFLPYFFKTGKGEYAEGDKFIGVVVPDSRKLVKEFWQKAELHDVQEILKSEFHEMRLVALLILVNKFEKSKDKTEQKSLVDFYLKNTKYINNWDLVDLSCYKLLGRYCFENQKDDVLRKLSNSENMWEKRIAIVATMHHIKKGKIFDLTKELVLNNLNHPHDLMHKANGWLLREIGNKDEEVLLDFLKIHYQNMPRTTLRYAIEKLEEDLRQDFLKGRI